MTIYADPEFAVPVEFLEDMDIELNVASAQEHVSLIERTIRTIKERHRPLYDRLPYRPMPKLMVKHAVYGCA